MSGLITIREDNHTRKSNVYLQARPFDRHMGAEAVNISINIQKTEDYEFIFRQYYQALCNYANTWLRDMDHAEEVVQDMFVRVWEKKTGTEHRRIG